MHEKVILREDLFFNQYFKVVTNGGRIKQGSKRIDQDRKFMTQHSPSDFFGKTRAHKQATAISSRSFPRIRGILLLVRNLSILFGRNLFVQPGDKKSEYFIRIEFIMQFMQATRPFLKQGPATGMQHKGFCLPE